MKKNYNAPKMTVHGNVEHITQAFNPSTNSDMIYVGSSSAEQGNQNAVPSTGSTDGIIVPVG